MSNKKSMRKIENHAELSEIIRIGEGYILNDRPETNSYLHDARLAVKTERDQQILEDFENANKQMRDAARESGSILEEMNDEKTEATTMSERFSREREQPYADNAAIDS
jgi:hypothetical protein